MSPATIDPAEVCPCRRMAAEPLTYEACCKPILDDGALAPTAESLMRARYSAFAFGRVDFLHDSLAPGARHDFDRKAIGQWSRSADWLGLEINGTEAGANDDTGFVSFTAHYVLDGKRQAHRERSLFRREAGHWYFVEEANLKSAPVVKGAQPGRNDPCPCGSGKKYKKCHGAIAA